MKCFPELSDIQYHSMLYRSATSHIRQLITKSMSTMSQSEAGPIEQKIVEKIQEAFKPVHFEINNDSYKHAHHAGLRGASNTTESHFRLVVVSSEFEKVGLPVRHRMIYKLLDDEMKVSGVHALQLKTKTPVEWERELAKQRA